MKSFLSRFPLAAVFPALLFSYAGFSAEKLQGEDSPAKGYSCLFLGHSFFAPIADNFAQLPAKCGFAGHKQTVVFHGGPDGAPGKLWDSDKGDVAQAKKLLEAGTVDLVGLTFYPDVGSSLSDYRSWVDMALKHNPKTRFVIQEPWPKYECKNIQQYEAEIEKCQAYIHQIIDQLRKAYPRTSFQCIPQGRWMLGLWKLLEEKKLPEVAVLMRSDNNDKRPCLFLDPLGHGGDIPVKQGGLLWLAIVYKADLGKCPLQTGTKTDLKKLAKQISLEDSYCGLGKAGE